MHMFRHHFVGKPVALQNVGCFPRLICLSEWANELIFLSIENALFWPHNVSIIGQACLVKMARYFIIRDKYLALLTSYMVNITYLLKHYTWPQVPYVILFFSVHLFP